MEIDVFYTKSKLKGYDIVYIGPRKKYSLYLNYKDYDVDMYGSKKPHRLSREKFDELIASCKKYEVYDLSNYDPDNYERFYRESVYDCNNNIDLLEIDIVKKEYVLMMNTSDLNSDGYDLIGNPIFSVYVGEIVFDAILFGIKELGFKEVADFDVFKQL